MYIWHTAYGTGGGTRQHLVRYTYNTVSRVFDPASKLILVDQKESTVVHNGAHVRCGPDGFLYFGNGDDNRPDVTTQRLNAGLFGGLFRIDVDFGDPGNNRSHAPPRQPTDCVTQGYGIPNDNPFVGQAGVNEEYYALGFRNPYRLNFDRQTGALWMGDVGDSFREEVNQIVPGGNYGWPYYEGTKRGSGAIVPALGVLQPPKYEYPHHQLADLTSIVGGYIYRGAAMPELQGKYIYTDYPVGRVWALDTVTGVRTSLVEQNYQIGSPVGFAQDRDGELFVVGWNKLAKLTPDAPHSVPKKLSETKIFRNLSTLLPSSSVKPYSIRSPLWSDGATKQRWVYVPEGSTATMNANGRPTLPVGSLLVKQFSLPEGSNPVSGRSRKLETRVLVVGATDTYGVTYRWNAAGTDADLVIEAADEVIADVDPSKSVDWHYPSFGECWSCHRKENRVLGFRGEQMNFDIDGQNQLAHLQAQGVFNGSIASSPAPLADPKDANASLDARASAYLAANCSGCHDGTASYLGGGPTWNGNPNVPANSRRLVGFAHNNWPMAGLLNHGTTLVAKGQPNQSILLGRVRSSDPDLQMPPMGRRKVDTEGAALLQAWIQALP